MAIYEYPYTDFNEYNLDWCIKRIRDLTDEWAATKTEWSDMKTELTNLKNYIMHYFENLDVQDEINHKLDEMAASGELTALMQPYIPDLVTGWLDENIIQEVGYVVDKTLTVTDAAADAKAVGDRFDEISETTQNLWLLGDQSYSISQVVNLDTAIPAGTYTLSAEILSSFTGISPNYNSKWIFYKGVIASSAVQASPYILGNAGRGSVTFTMADYADIIVMYASNNNANSQSNISCEWKNIQLESGSSATDYIPPVTAVDYRARTGAALEINDAIKSIIGSYTGPDSFSIYLDPPENLAYPFVVNIDAKYEQSGTNEYPSLRFWLKTDRNLQRNSMKYEIGCLDKYEMKSYRPIPYVWDDRYNQMIVTIPDDVTLTIRNAYISKETGYTRTSAGVQFHAHDGSCNIAPPQTLFSYKMALASGYNSAIVIPKITSDGVWFAYHDDTFDISTTYLRNPDGTAITDPTYDGMRFNQIPWSYLKDLIIYGYGSGTFADSHLMKIDEFLEFCSKTGMKPVFSMHPLSMYTDVVLADLRNLVRKYDLLPNLTLKQPVAFENGAYTLSNLAACHAVFGNDIYAYEANCPSAMPDPTIVTGLFTALTQITTRKVIEYWASQILTDEAAGQIMINSDLSNNIHVSCGFDSYNEYGTALNTFSAGLIRKLINMGVSEFTEQYNTSNGLYW